MSFPIGGQATVQLVVQVTWLWRVDLGLQGYRFGVWGFRLQGLGFSIQGCRERKRTVEISRLM